MEIRVSDVRDERGMKYVHSQTGVVKDNKISPRHNIKVNLAERMKWMKVDESGKGGRYATLTIWENCAFSFRLRGPEIVGCCIDGAMARIASRSRLA